MPETKRRAASSRHNLQCVPSRRRLRIAEHDTDLHTDLIDEDDHHIRLRDDGGQFAERLRHEPRLTTHMMIPHLPLDLRPRDERGDRIDHDHIHRIRSDERLHDIERLFSGIRLGNEQLIHIHADLLRIFRIHRMLGVDECRDTALFLRVRDDMEREGRLPG
jgi:hypothetical protein